MSTAPETLAPGSVIAGKYRVVRELGQGGFGAVYEIAHLRIPGQRLALKIMHPSLNRDEGRRARFVREIQVNLRLTHHNIVTVRDCEATEALTYYTMDFVDGKPLDVILKSGGALPVARAVDLARQALHGLSAAHAEKVVHRDVKPGNLIVASGPGGRDVVKVLDFGIAKIVEEGASTTQDAAFVGTPAYLSPEQAQGKHGADPRSDIYSLGVVLYEMLAGRLPFLSESVTGFIFQHSYEEAQPISRVAPEKQVPPALDAIVLRALAKEPEKRFQSAEEMDQALERCMAGPTPSPRPATSVDATVNLPPGELGLHEPRGFDWEAPLVGQTVDKYKITKLLGEGGFGVVCSALHTMIGRRVALKLLRPELGAEAGFMERFRREAQLASSLEHPAIVTIYDYGEISGACYIAMEFVEGRTLGEVIKEARALEPARMLELLRPVLEAIGIAHAVKVVHRDLKPANIMVGKDSRVKVLDFGIAKIVGGGGSVSLTQEGAIVGSAHYISPEQVLGGSIDTRADIYSLGCIVFECLTGRPPFVKPKVAECFRAHVKEAPPKLRAIHKTGAFSDALEAVVAKMLAKQPEDRYQTTAEAIAGLEMALRPSPMSVADTPSGVATGKAPAQPRSGGVAAVKPGAAGGSTGVVGAGSVRSIPVPVAGPPLGHSLRIELREAPHTRYFIFGGPVLRFGRAKPGGTGENENHLILRVLPCRSQQQDAKNFLLTNEISGKHGEFAIDHGAPVVIDRSSRGTFIEAVRVQKGTPTRLPEAFRMNVAGSLELTGQVFPRDAGAKKPVESVRLRRLGNEENDVYVWVPRRAKVGAEEAIDLPLARGASAELRFEGDALVLDAGHGVAPLSVGDVALGGVAVYVGTATPGDQVDRG